MKNHLCEQDVKLAVMQLVGKGVKVKVNRGRNRIKHYQGVVSQAHANVFVVELANDVLDRISCSYCDVLCGEISLKEQQPSA